MSSAFPFDAVLFDLDGTLVATDRFWVQAADRGARRAFAERGLTRALPTEADWMSLVGLPLHEGFHALFEDLDEADRAHVLERCLEEERAALKDGGAALLPGAREVLGELRARGVRTGIASNCGAEYLEAMCAGRGSGGLGLGALVDEAYCLDTPGIRTKADMLRRLCEVFDTRSAVMVGDRYTDAEAAWTNGLPHVHLVHGFAPEGERIECEARLTGLDQLLARLGRRDDWIDGVLAELGALDPGVARIAVLGPELAGKSLFARDAARRLRALGRAEGPRWVEASPACAEELGDTLAAVDRALWLEVGERTLERRRRALGRPPRPAPWAPWVPGGASAAGGPPPQAPGRLLRVSADNPLGPG